MEGMLLLVDPDKCTGCRTCEVACSMRHFWECNPTRSMIKVIRYEKQGEYFVSIPVVCQQCETPMCKGVCPVNAIHQDPKTGAYVVNQDVCMGCRLCVIACPVSGISIDPEANIAVKCDLCGGDPLCARFCANGAITYVRRDKIGRAKAREGALKISELLTLTATAARGA
ncbi:MAG: 4Fe-4S dicluster domain-containing protein [Candidatus Bathyarchaeia archaeon]